MAVPVALAAAGVGIQAFGTITSFAQASSQRKLRDQALNKAEEAMEKAEKRAEVNVMDALSIAKQPYELEREKILTQGATALQAATEGDVRGVAATSGRIQLAQQEAFAKSRGKQEREMVDLQKSSAQEEARLMDYKASLALGEVQGAQIAARDAAKSRAAAIAQGFKGLSAAATSAIDFIPLYKKSESTKAFENAISANPDIKSIIAKMGSYEGVDFSGVGNMSDLQFEDFMTSNFDKKQLNSLFTNLVTPETELTMSPSTITTVQHENLNTQ